MKNKKIMVPFGVVTQLQKEGLGSRPTIGKALKGEYNAMNRYECKRALLIRQRALNMGGVEIDS